MNCKVSIIITVYNIATYVRSCVQSILSQTYADFELICVDDGSTDDSGKILEELSQTDGRIQVIHKANGGAASARNAGLARATGDLVMFMDGDDIIPPDYLEKHLVARGDGDNIVTIAGYEIRNADGTTIDVELPVAGPDLSIADLMVSMLRKRWSPIIHSWLWPREAVIQAGPWREDIVWQDDLEYSFRVLSYCRGATIVSGTRAIYRRHAGSLSDCKKPKKGWSSIVKAAEGREVSALRVEDGERMRFALSQWWYEVLFKYGAIEDDVLRKIAWDHLTRLGLPPCEVLDGNPRRAFIAKMFGIRALYAFVVAQNKIRRCLYGEN